jgi:endonuclease/exonuclease/phosphatase family metal-dependent hydrolase
VRVATFNILGGRSPADGRVDEERFARAIRSLDADLLGLQEVDRGQPRSQDADLTAVAADAMGATHHRFVAALSGTPDRWRAATGEEPPGSPAYGIAFLSRYDVRDWRVVRLPGAPVRVPHRSEGGLLPAWVRDEPRVAVVAEVDAPGGPLRVVTTHLSFLRPWNLRQLRRLMAALPRTGDHPTLLLGDLNLGPRTAHRLTSMTPLVTGPTFPAPTPRLQIDHILTSGPPGPTRGEVVALAVSDHRALVVDL